MDNPTPQIAKKMDSWKVHYNVLKQNLQDASGALGLVLEELSAKKRKLAIVKEDLKKAEKVLSQTKSDTIEKIRAIRKYRKQFEADINLLDEKSFKTLSDNRKKLERVQKSIREEDALSKKASDGKKRAEKEYGVVSSKLKKGKGVLNRMMKDIGKTDTVIDVQKEKLLEIGKDATRMIKNKDKDILFRNREIERLDKQIAKKNESVSGFKENIRKTRGEFIRREKDIRILSNRLKKMYKDKFGIEMPNI